MSLAHLELQICQVNNIALELENCFKQLKVKKGPLKSRVNTLIRLLKVQQEIVLNTHIPKLCEEIDCRDETIRHLGSQVSSLRNELRQPKPFFVTQKTNEQEKPNCLRAEEEGQWSVAAKGRLEEEMIAEMARLSVFGLQLDTEELGLVKNEIADTMIKERMERHSQIHEELLCPGERLLAECRSSESSDNSEDECDNSNSSYMSRKNTPYEKAGERQSEYLQLTPVTIPHPSAGGL